MVIGFSFCLFLLFTRNLFIPSSPHSLTPSIFTVILHDPSAKVRSVASSTLTIIIDGSKNYLLAANERYLFIYLSFTHPVSAKTKTGSFTPFSQTLGSMIREIHNGLSAALDSEKNTSSLNQILKVFLFFLFQVIITLECQCFNCQCSLWKTFSWSFNWNCLSVKYFCFKWRFFYSSVLKWFLLYL